MKIEELKKAILQLSPQDRLCLMQEVGPELCESIMRDPKAIANMTRFCRWMMSGSPEMKGCSG